MQVELNKYKQQVADLYSSRSGNYDKGDWHPRIAHRLVEYAHLRPGQKILDIATGTGMVAIEAAQIVGSTGQMIGIDIATGMIEQARVEFDAELEAMQTEQGIWDDGTIFYVFGQKAA
jgi:ubiquinone/menaquinone biosynthesis C-methylase UbiE